jgi:hypothetical protein
MIVTVEIRDEWIAEYRQAIDGDLGSNDDEHDLLGEVADAIVEASRTTRDGEEVNAVIRREYVGGAEDVSYFAFVDDVVQDDEVARMIAEEMLKTGEEYHYNLEEPSCYERFTIINKEVLIAQMAAEDAQE